MTTNQPHLLCEVQDRIAVLTLNRPEKLNALSPQMLQEAITTLERCATDPAVGCVVVTGAGRGFCAGGDIETMKGRGAGMTFEERVDRQRWGHRFSELLHSI